MRFGGLMPGGDNNPWSPGSNASKGYGADREDKKPSGIDPKTGKHWMQDEAVKNRVEQRNALQVGDDTWAYLPESGGQEHMPVRIVGMKEWSSKLTVRDEAGREYEIPKSALRSGPEDHQT